MRRLIVLVVALPLCAAQPLTLEEAQATALKNHPQVSTALLNALAANQVTIEARSAYFPTLTGNVTAAGAMDGSRLAAGALNNPVIYNRISSGMTISQVISDFGRTGSLAESARLRAEARKDDVQTARAQILLQVNRAYYAALSAQNVVRVAQQTVAARQTVFDQVSALAASKLKSGLDVSFSGVSLAEAKLLVASAENQRDAAFADLSAAMGFNSRQSFDLADVAASPELPPDSKEALAQAMQNRPEAAAARAEQGAQESFAEAEHDLRKPTVSALASVGVTPGHEDTLRGRYGALGFNLSIPVFNGHLFSARENEARLRAQAARQLLRQIENQIARDVEIAWLNANTAFQRLALTSQLLEQAGMGLELAQTRYDLGLSNIVELTQAQLAKTSAEIASVTARYDYQLQSAVLRYQAGTLR